MKKKGISMALSFPAAGELTRLAGAEGKSVSEYIEEMVMRASEISRIAGECGMATGEFVSEAVERMAGGKGCGRMPVAGYFSMASGGKDRLSGMKPETEGGIRC